MQCSSLLLLLVLLPATSLEKSVLPSLPLPSPLLSLWFFFVFFLECKRKLYSYVYLTFICSLFHLSSTSTSHSSPLPTYLHLTTLPFNPTPASPHSTPVPSLACLLINPHSHTWAYLSSPTSRHLHLATSYLGVPRPLRQLPRQHCNTNTQHIPETQEEAH